ncbi:hypothetical protein QBC38DRAFT_2230 [Podospora fimiseda]|uniref:Uncharacterized protein n=1 Tax=Podospora fimiseda TaxID=252190 RepID=A0AAN7BZK5_9PEZI|nr:hypothetical protein QBC38DRAFT_2230 [Podospora fimiseda]
MAPKLIILTGAPESNKLDWNPAGLLNEFQDSVARFAGINKNNQPSPPTSSAQDLAVWRSLPLKKDQKHTGLTQQYDSITINSTAPEFFITELLSFTSDQDHDSNPVLSQFYEHSMAVHQEMPSSQLRLDDDMSQQAKDSLVSDGTSFVSNEPSQPPAATKEPLQSRKASPFVDLKDIPSTAYLQKILPQTMSLNIIAGIISISQPRMIKTRWGTKYLVEVLVGDETKAGFAITYWLPTDSVSASPLAGLRSGDIVLMQNVGLSAFMNKVYGSSLRKDLTKVKLLHRMKLDARDTGGYYTTHHLAHSMKRRSSRRTSQASTSKPPDPHPELVKTRLVRDWVLNFVGTGDSAVKGAKAVNGKPNPRRRWEQPPDDDSQMP